MTVSEVRVGVGWCGGTNLTDPTVTRPSSESSRKGKIFTPLTPVSRHPDRVLTRRKSTLEVRGKGSTPGGRGATRVRSFPTFVKATRGGSGCVRGGGGVNPGSTGLCSLSFPSSPRPRFGPKCLGTL